MLKKIFIIDIGEAFSYLSIPIETRTKQDWYTPKILKNDAIRQAASPAHHDTVAAQNISIGINVNVTYCQNKID